MAERVDESESASVSEAREAGVEATAPAPSDRRVRVAVLASIGLTFGAGHFYVRRHRVGLALAVLEAVVIAIGLRTPMFFWALPLVVLGDLIGAVGTVRALQQGRPTSVLARWAPALGMVGLVALPAVRVIAPEMIAGPRAIEACQRGAECLAEDASHCVERAADGVMRGELTQARVSECAQCLADLACHQAERECAGCRPFVALHEPPPLFPRGGAPTDMQLPIPSLFAPTDAPHGPPIGADLLGDDLGLGDDLPPLPLDGPIGGPPEVLVPPSSLPTPRAPTLGSPTP